MRATLTAKSRAVPTCTSAPTANLCMRPFGMISCTSALRLAHIFAGTVAVTRATAALTRSRSFRSAPTGLLPRCAFACAHTYSVRPCNAACTRCARGMHASCLVVQATTLHAMWHATLRATWHVAFRVSRFTLRAQVGDVSSGGKTPRNFCIVRSAPRLHVCEREGLFILWHQATGLRRWGCYRGECARRGVCETVLALCTGHWPVRL
jgi:hypothetical protein